VGCFVFCGFWDLGVFGLRFGFAVVLDVCCLLFLFLNFCFGFFFVVYGLWGLCGGCLSLLFLRWMDARIGDFVCLRFYLGLWLIA